MKAYFILACLLVIAMGHSQLIAEIVSSVERPLTVRAGLVIMSYAMIFTVLWLSFKLFNKPDQEDKGNYYGSDEIWVFVLCLSFGLTLLIFFAADFGQEVQLRDQLQQKGVSHVGVVRGCHSTKRRKGGGTSSCSISYEYEIRLTNHTTTLYQVKKESIHCARECNIGSSIDIAYLPQTPSKAGIAANTHDLWSGAYSLACLFDLFVLFPLSICLHYVISKWKRKLKREDEV